MEAEFWRERWKENQIGFHQADFHPALAAYWHRLGVAKGKKVFVPLCGKSLDMLWLLGQGYLVEGIELSELALNAFFVENKIACVKTQSGEFVRCVADQLELLCGDFFKLTPDQFADVAAMYDRASLIALPQEMRRAYAAHLTCLALPSTRLMLVTLSYPQEQMSGPPFSVQETEVRGLYGEHWDIQLLDSQEVLAQNKRFQQQGITTLQETIYQLQRK